MRQISLANPHAEIAYVPPKAEEHGERHVVPARQRRAAARDAPRSSRTRYGVELGVLMQMLRDTTGAQPAPLPRRRTSPACRRDGRRRDLQERAGVAESRRPLELSREEAERIHEAIQADEDHGAADGLHRADRRGAARARAARRGAGRVLRGGHAAPAVYRGNPFLIEVGLAYGGELPAEEPITLYRFANRVPLQYQQGACAITKAVTGTDWRPTAPAAARRAAAGPDGADGAHRERLGAVHLREQGGDRALPRDHQGDAARAAGVRAPRRRCYIRKRRREADEAKKRAYIEKYIPQVAIGLQQILELSRRAARPGRRRTSRDVLERSRKLKAGRTTWRRRRRPRRPAARRRRRRPAEDMARRNAALDDVVVQQIRDGCDRVHRDILASAKPDLAFPVRSLGNVKYAEKKGYFEIGRAEEDAHAHREHGEELRADAAHDGALEGAGGDQRLRDEARRLLPEQELGRGASSTSRPSRTP